MAHIAANLLLLAYVHNGHEPCVFKFPVTELVSAPFAARAVQFLFVAAEQNMIVIGKVRLRQQICRSLGCLFQLLDRVNLLRGLTGAHHADKAWRHRVEHQTISVHFRELVQICKVKHLTLAQLNLRCVFDGLVDCLRWCSVFVYVGHKLDLGNLARQLDSLSAKVLCGATPVLEPLNCNERVQITCEKPRDHNNIVILLMHKNFGLFLSAFTMHPVENLPCRRDVPGNLEIGAISHNVVHVPVAIICLGLLFVQDPFAIDKKLVLRVDLDPRFECPRVLAELSQFQVWLPACHFTSHKYFFAAFPGYLESKVKLRNLNR